MLRTVLTVLAGAIAICASPPSIAAGTAVDVEIVDRGTGETLVPVLHAGEWWVAGRPGARYGVTIVNRNSRRTLNVVSIDGVNAISGETAAWNQTGYVLEPFERWQINGWRKDADQVAAFEFTALPDSYAARTGRAANVGVIVIAMFNERVVRPRLPQRDAAPGDGDRARQDTRSEALPPAPPSASARAPAPPVAPSPGAPSAPSGPQAQVAGKADRSVAAPERLGTGHGALEASSIRDVDFRRAGRVPDEIVTIHYDRKENLIAMGILPTTPVADAPSHPLAFPGSTRYVPDPPVRP